jgi:hypothetical protein
MYTYNLAWVPTFKIVLTIVNISNIEYIKIRVIDCGSQALESHFIGINMSG